VEVTLGRKEGLPRACVANLDSIHAVAIKRLEDKIGRLSPERHSEIERARGYALDVQALKSL
jgi:mRNA-degrading endonuclease toxin of MazEF toxin-antitoxin module